MSYLLKIKDATFKKFQYPVFQDTSWEMHPEENWAVVGANGAGKTTFLEIVEGRLMKIKGEIDCNFADADAGNVSGQIAAVYFNDPSINYGSFYYQQRYNATETDSIVTVRNFLKLNAGDSLPELEAFEISHLLDMEIIKLSNGQFKKMLIAKALMKKPRLLLLDNLYTGLDSQARDYISRTISQITLLGTNVITVVDRHIPDSITHVMEIENFAIKNTSPVRNYIPAYRCRQYTLPVLPDAPAKTFDTAVKLENVSIVYNGKTVVNQLEWTVSHGEKWALTGANGSGKSMLLSLIFADNPQAYANNIILFDRKRGTGESIWDIKDNIGFVSPEMHLYFNRNKTCREVALSGLSENPHRKVKPVDKILQLTDSLFDYFSITGICNDLFRHVSTGQQNMILLIRATVKNPAMLALDEPFQGMDFDSVTRAKQLLDEYCKNRTLIFVSHEPDELPSCISRHFHLSN
ncbi:MAG: ATP-binding cassette domain-containing protein [Prevotellaceae bacterium]|jgi:molybdate transport system ATP-binding protein|nr:ATP-binding cassette domain-containing protein [Prevotellaceae bacterium]